MMTALGLAPRRMRSVRVSSRRAGSMFQERGSLSTNTGVAADLLLEGLEVGAGWGDPVGAEGLVDEVELAAAHVGGREVEAGRGGAAARGLAWRGTSSRTAGSGGTPRGSSGGSPGDAADRRALPGGGGRDEDRAGAPGAAERARPDERDPRGAARSLDDSRGPAGPAGVGDGGGRLHRLGDLPAGGGGGARAAGAAGPARGGLSEIEPELAEAHPDEAVLP